MIALSRATLSLIPAHVGRPAYDPRAVTTGIVHLGLGGFHRAHLARYIHDLMNIDAGAVRWGIAGSGLRASDSPLLSQLDAQDCLYTLVERDGAGATNTVIGSIARTIDATASTAALLTALTAPATQIVSVTVSERGYSLDTATKRLDFARADVRHDIANPKTPRSVPGLLVEALRRRRATGTAPFTALCCDNIQHNGRVLRGAVVALAAATDATLATWIDRNAAFPNAMVDRITPMPTSASIDAANAATGIADGATLVAESFRQWVLEDSFASDRPEWERVGVQMVADVTPYETMKLRLLNASHLAIAGIGALLGYETVLDAIGDDMIRSYMMQLMDTETGPTLPPVPGIDLDVYKATLIARFANPAIRDTLRRINQDAPINLLLDPLRDRLADGASIDLLALALAAWCARVRHDAGAAVAAGDPPPDEVHRRALAARDDVGGILATAAVFGDLGRDTRLIDAVNTGLKRINVDGVRRVLHDAVAVGGR